MSSSYYSRIYNTVVTEAALQNDLSATALRNLLNANALAPAAVVDVTANAILTLDNWIVALTAPNGLGLSGGALGADRELYIFSDAVDTAAYAQSLISLFNLSSSAKPVVANFHVAAASVTANDVKLNNKAASSSNVGVALDGGIASTSRVLMTGGSAVAGDLRQVEIYCNNFTSGSEVVIFNICDG